MNNFFKYLFASCLGTGLALICLTFFGICTVSGLASSLEKKKVSVGANSVLELKFESPVPEKTNNLDMGFSLNEDKILGLHDIVQLNLGYLITFGLSIIGGSGATRREMAELILLHRSKPWRVPINRTESLARADQAQRGRGRAAWGAHRPSAAPVVVGAERAPGTRARSAPTVR